MKNHLQRLFCLLLANFMLFAGVADARMICIAEVTTNNLNVRAAPSTDAEVVTQLNQGQQIGSADKKNSLEISVFLFFNIYLVSFLAEKDSSGY